MNQELQIFNFEKHKVRTVFKDGEPWFILKDVCEALDLSQPARVAMRLEEREKGITQSNTLGGVQNLIIVNEPGLYKVIFRSDKPNSQKFVDWIAYDVLPSIRKKGYYALPDSLPKQLDFDWLSDTSKVAFADASIASKESMPLGTFARFLKTRGIDTGRKRLFETLREQGYLVKAPPAERNNPTQVALKARFLEIVKKVSYDDSGKPHARTATYITNLGQLFFFNLFKRPRRALLEKAGEVLAG